MYLTGVGDEASYKATHSKITIINKTHVCEESGNFFQYVIPQIPYHKKCILILDGKSPTNAIEGHWKTFEKE